MKNLKSIIFWGACWGVLEATLGWLLHLIHFKGEVLIQYPLGLLCMMMAFKQTGKTSSVFKVAVIASIVKLTNVLINPAVPFYYVTNPAIAIILEGLVTWVFCLYVQERKRFAIIEVPLATILMFSAILLFRSWQIIMDAFVAYNPAVHIPIDGGLLMQWIVRSAIQGVMLVSVYYLARVVKVNTNFSKLTKHLAIPSLLIAILLNIFI